MLVALPLCACADPGRLVQGSALAGRPVVTTSGPPLPFERRRAPVPSGVALTGEVMGPLVTQIAEANEVSRSRIGTVIAPALDPAAAVEKIVARHLVQSYGARLGLRKGEVGHDLPDLRAPELARLARLQGIDGIVVDVQATELAAVSTGVRIGLRPETFYLVFAARLGLVDGATGELLAAGACEITADERLYSFPEMQAGGQPLMDRAVEVLAQQCAADLIGRLLI